MKNPRLVPVAIMAATLASCSVPQPPSRQAPVAPPAAAAPTPAPGSPMLTIDGYKKAFAQQVAHGNPHLFEGPLPDMFKSIVVLDVTIGREGEVLKVAVHRSNGFKALEK